MTVSAPGGTIPALLALAVCTPCMARAAQPESKSDDPSEDEWGEAVEGEWDEDEWLEDGGFDDAGFADITTTATLAPEEPRYWSISGVLRTDNALWVERFDDNPFAKARQNLDLRAEFKRRAVRAVAEVHLEYDLAYLYERDSYGAATRSAYEWQIEPRELFASVALGPFDLTVGRQIIAWGTGDVISPLDVVNPRDTREPGLADLDDLRVPVLASRLGFFLGSNKLEAIMIHEAFFGYRGPPLGPFSSLPSLIDPMLVAALSDRTVRYRDEPGRFISTAQQFLLRWRYAGVGADVSLYAASVLLRNGVLALPPPDALMGTGDIEIILDHPRYTMLGQSGAVAVGSFLLRWELALDLARPINVGSPTAMPPRLAAEDHNVLNAMIGATYSGIENASFVLEVGQGLVVDGRPDAGDGPLMLDEGAGVVIGPAPEFLLPVEEPTFSLRILYTFLRDRMQAAGAVTVFGYKAQLGALARAELAYNIRDALQVSLGYITYQPGSELGPLTGLSSHDRLFLKLRWDFVAW